MVTRETWYVGSSLLLLAVFAAAAAVLIAGIYTTLPINLVLFVIAPIVALTALYGFYRIMTAPLAPTPLSEQSIAE